MRRSTNVMLTTLAVVCVVTVIAVAVALVRYEGEGQNEHGTKHGETQTAPNNTPQHNSTIESHSTGVEPDTHGPAHDE